MTIKELLDKINDKLDKLDAKLEAKLDKLDAKFETKFDKLEADVSELKATVAAQGGKLDGIEKRLGSVEFTVRIILVAWSWAWWAVP